MVEVTVEDFEKDFDSYLDRIEAGETFIIRQPDGRGVVACPAGDLEAIADEVGVDDWQELMTTHDDAS
tara:strand:+ start:285 stop:488 length:204 start_codon:yes stop_codon:yes gene_type:complete